MFFEASKFRKEINELQRIAPSGDKIVDACDRLALFLLRKNVSYGNSALEYRSVFGSLTAREALYARINDKLQRIENNQTLDGAGSLPNESFLDAVDDLIGYLLLLKILLEE